MVGVSQRKKKTATAAKRRVDEEHEEEQDVNPRARQLPRAYAQDNARKQRKKLAKRLRKTQYAYLSMSGFDYTTMAVSTAGGGGGDEEAICDVWCPSCRLKLSADDVEKGFQESVLDYRTQCPECQFRFETSFAFERDGAKAHFVWLCPEQTRDQYALWREKRDFDQDEEEEIADVLLKDRPEIFFNAYRYAEPDDGSVKERVCQFLDI